MGLGIKSFLIRKLRKAGIEIVKYPNGELERRLKIIDHCNINKLLDVGANEGQYASLMRELGFNGEIISFEPLSKAYQVLEKESAKDKKWQSFNCALGDSDTKSVINIAGNSQSSSILSMLPEHIDSAPESKFVDTEEIEIKTLDKIFNEIAKPGDSLMLKIDTQGYEKMVLDGAAENLHKFAILQLEMSTVPLYNNEMLYMEMINYLAEKGFVLYAFETNFINPQSGKLLQLDGIFVNEKLIQLPKN